MTSERGGASFSLDRGTPFGARVARHLTEDLVVWLTTVGPAGQPEPSPVWFLWDGAASVLMYSRPSPRVRNIAANPRVALNFPGDGAGGDIVVLSGVASADDGAGPADAVPEYLAKYRSSIGGIGLTPREFSGEYRQPIRIRLTGLRGH